MLGFWHGPNFKLCSLQEALSIPELATIVGQIDRSELSALQQEIQIPFLTIEERQHICNEHRRALFEQRSISKVHWLESGFPVITWSRVGGGSSSFFISDSRPAYFAPFGIARVIGMSIHKTVESTYSALLLNSDNPFVLWMERLRESCVAGKYGLSREQFGRLFTYVYDFIEYHGGVRQSDYLSGWQQMEVIPEELRPPITRLSVDLLRFTKEEKELLAHR